MSKKHKGMSQPLPLSVRMQAQREAELRAVRIETAVKVVELVYLVDAIAENEVAGWGDTRVKRRQAKSQEIMAEVKDLVLSDGFEYAHSVLQRRYHQTVKQVEEAEQEE